MCQVQKLSCVQLGQLSSNANHPARSLVPLHVLVIYQRLRQFVSRVVSLVLGGSTVNQEVDSASKSQLEVSQIMWVPYNVLAVYELLQYLIPIHFTCPAGHQPSSMYNLYIQQNRHMIYPSYLKYFAPPLFSVLIYILYVVMDYPRADSNKLEVKPRLAGFCRQSISELCISIIQEQKVSGNQS